MTISHDELQSSAMKTLKREANHRPDHPQQKHPLVSQKLHRKIHLLEHSMLQDFSLARATKLQLHLLHHRLLTRSRIIRTNGLGCLVQNVRQGTSSKVALLMVAVVGERVVIIASHFQNQREQHLPDNLLI